MLELTGIGVPARTSQDVMRQNFRDVASNGGFVFGGVMSDVMMYTTIGLGGEATLYGIQAPYFNQRVSSERALLLAGVLRKSGLVKRCFEACYAGDIEVGDKLVYHDGDGNQVVSFKVKERLFENITDSVRPNVRSVRDLPLY